MVSLSYRPARNLVSRRQVMNRSFDPLHLVNTYGAFGSISRVRLEVAVEGTDEPVLHEGTVWREYGFAASRAIRAGCRASSPRTICGSTG